MAIPKKEFTVIANDIGSYLQSWNIQIPVSYGSKDFLLHNL
jgi:hypothetical protein